MLKIAKFLFLIVIVFVAEVKADDKVEVAVIFDNFDRTPIEENIVDSSLDGINEFDEYDEFFTEKSLEIYDPFEKFNRKIYAFNNVFDRYFLEYVARAYRKAVPKFGRKLIGNFVNNLALPLSAVNSFLQGKVDNGLATISNFLINSTIGVLGIFDVAANKGIFYNQEDFGQTIGYYNIGSGAYLMLPFLGPSTVRDFSGWSLNRAISIDGFNLLEIGGDENIVHPAYLVALSGISAINTRESLLETIDDIRRDSFDSYATIRSAYLQRRINEISK